MCAVVSDSLVTWGGNAEGPSQLINPLKVIQNTSEVQFPPLWESLIPSIGKFVAC